MLASWNVEHTIPTLCAGQITQYHLLWDAQVEGSIAACSKAWYSD